MTFSYLTVRMLDLTAAFDITYLSLIFELQASWAALFLGLHPISLIDTYSLLSITSKLQNFHLLSLSRCPSKLCSWTFTFEYLLGHIVHCHGLSYHLYADDLQIYISASVLSLDSLNAFISDIRIWLHKTFHELKKVSNVPMCRKRSLFFFFIFFFI